MKLWPNSRPHLKHHGRVHHAHTCAYLAYYAFAASEGGFTHGLLCAALLLLVCVEQFEFGTSSPTPPINV